VTRLGYSIAIGTGVLLIVGVALFWQSYNNKILPLYPNEQFRLYNQSDSFSLGGASTSEVIPSPDGGIVLICKINQSAYSWPFCNITVDMSTIEGERTAGLDLTRYSTIRLKARYLNTPYMGFRVQLRTFNPQYSKVDDIETWKFLTYELAAPAENGVFDIPLNALKVPNWWLVHNKAPVKYAVPEFDQVMVFELATGNNIPSGRYEIHIESVELVGKHLSDNELLYSLVALLSFAVFGYLLINIKEYRTTVMDQRDTLLALSKRNEVLTSKNDSLKSKVNIDALTGVLNRHASEQILPKLRKGDCVILMDIDHFKSINDQYGHDVGDKVLCLFAQVITSCIRSQDFFIRWGGEEFLCVCPNVSVQNGQLIANKFKEALTQQVWPEAMAVTSSYGVAEMAYGESVDMLIKRADSALYQAKHKGRNRVVSS